MIGPSAAQIGAGQFIQLVTDTGYGERKGRRGLGAVGYPGTADGFRMREERDRPGGLSYKVTGFSRVNVRRVSEAILTCWPLVAA
jgi:hypothetical protein